MDRRGFLAAAGGMAALAGCGKAGIWEDDCPPIGIWDNHCHMGGGPGKTPAERIDHLLKLADRVGVEHLSLHLGMVTGVEDPTPEQLTQDNNAVLEACRHAGSRVHGYVYLNPNHLDFSLKEFDRCVRDGPMIGVKLWIAKRCNAPELDPIVRRAAEQKAPIYQHTWLKVQGNQPGESTPFDIVELARRHPGVKLLCGHSGGDWERGIRAIRSTPNLFLEIAGSDPTSGFVEMAVRELGAERIIYGSDVGGRSFGSQIAKVTGAAIPDAAKRLILRENLRSLLGPILKAKGAG
jgi:predicted TIM-barrel fold metal-dependent hydrolase